MVAHPHGAAATLKDAAKAGTGSTATTVQIDQTANGGGGGGSDTGKSGAGGAATADQNVQSPDSTNLYVEMPFLSPPAAPDVASRKALFAPLEASRFFGRGAAPLAPATDRGAYIQRGIAGSFSAFDAAGLRHEMPGSVPIHSAAHLPGLFGALF